MDPVFQQILKLFTFTLLQIPSPALEAPANWLIPILLWLSLARHAVRLIRDEQFHWFASVTKNWMLRLANLVENGLTHPQVHPLREMFIDLGVCILDYLLSLHFILLGLLSAVVSIIELQQMHYQDGAIKVLFWVCFMLIARWYGIRGVKGRLSLELRWRSYQDKSCWSICQLSIAPLLCISAAVLANLAIPK